jgi:predicted fused transcriptional regulator/phosphomethylpyrimidine kinase
MRRTAAFSVTRNNPEMTATDPVSEALKRLQRSLRDESCEVSAADAVLNFAVPEDLAGPEAETLFLGEIEAADFRAAAGAIAVDLRFEYMTRRVAGDPLRDALIRFACLCEMDRESDHVSSFFSEHMRTPEERTCFIDVEYLRVSEVIELLGLRLLPVDHPDVPERTGFFTLGAQVGAVAAVPSEGTHLGVMKDRAATVAERELRVLRLSLRGNRYLNPLQMRFGLAENYSFGGPAAAGFQTSESARWELTLDEELIELVKDQPLRVLAVPPENDLRECASRAMGWIEDSMIEGDRLKSLLYLFFALEALLGVKSENEKGLGLAFRRALLSFATKEHFADPDRAYRLYGEVRSAAVHGGAIPRVSKKTEQVLLWDVREALIEYMELAEQHNFRTRKTLLRHLRQLPDRTKLAHWLLERDPKSWEKYLRKIEVL